MNLLPSFNRFSDLPEDIGRTVFELAAENGDGPRCALVSRRVQFWVEPKIYYRIILHKDEVGERFCRTLLGPDTSKPPKFFATYIKIFISTIGVSDQIAAALKLCRGVQSLVLWDHDTNRNAQDIYTSSEPLLTPAGLSIFGEMFLEKRYTFDYPFFRKITHLDIACFEEDDWKRASTLSQLKDLTHLSLDLRYSPSSLVQMVREVLCLCASELRILILWCDLLHFSDSHGTSFGDIKAIWEGEVDMRAITGCLEGDFEGLEGEFAIRRVGDDMLRDWAGTSADPENGFWAQAEARVQARRQHRRLDQRPLAEYCSRGPPKGYPVLSQGIRIIHFEELGKYVLKD